MKSINPLIANYHSQKLIQDKMQVICIKKLKNQIKLTKELLDKLRVHVRNHQFKEQKEEIYFFKHIKPSVCADLIYFKSQLKYQLSKPNTINSLSKNYLKNQLKKLESKKRKNLNFYKYYKQENTFLDNVYFLRENKQLDLFSADLSIHIDSEFYTSHDTLAAEVIAYDLLTNFYKKEINKLKAITAGKFNNSQNIKSPINWTASKTDLIELIYALKISGAVNTGHINTKELVTFFSSMFNIEVTNVYKTYSEIKNRNTERSKFLNKLLHDFEAKLEYDDGI